VRRFILTFDDGKQVKSTGREGGGDFAHVLPVHNGKVVRFHEYMGTAAAAAAHRGDKYDEAGA
jgi:ketosteroid isomerase-like protein